MMTCKQVSTLVSAGELGHASVRQRVSVWIHLAMCRHCRAFRRQLDFIGRVARGAAKADEAEPRDGFEDDLVDRLRR